MIANETRSGRRTFLKVLGGLSAASAVASPLIRAFANPGTAQDDFFIFIHAQGGWDVTLSLDPRNEQAGLIVPASTNTIDTSALTRWQNDSVPLDGAADYGFKPVQPGGSRIVFGPAIGDLADHFDRLTIFNGLAVNTVSHQDGTAFAATGRHLAGGHVAASSIDTMMANEAGTSQLFPAVSIRFPSSFIGDTLDRRAMPLLVDSIGSMGKSLVRSTRYDLPETRAEVTALLSQEAKDLAAHASDPAPWNGFAQELATLPRMLSGPVQALLDANQLKVLQPTFNYAGKQMGTSVVNAAFAVEAMKQNLVRSVAFAMGSFDTHGADYVQHGLKQQETFDMLARLIEVLDATPHPTKPTARLSEHTHIVVVSEFCRTPQINLGGGRDHYPNGSALVISPRFKANAVFGASDPDQLLPAAARKFTDGDRSMGPPDLLATFLSAFGVDPRKYMRDGEAMPEVLR